MLLCAEVDKEEYNRLKSTLERHISFNKYENWKELLYWEDFAKADNLLVFHQVGDEALMGYIIILGSYEELKDFMLTDILDPTIEMFTRNLVAARRII